jgi:molybdopterin converting factor small subunit
MRVLVSTFGTEVRLRQEVNVESASGALHEVLRALRAGYRAPLERFLTEGLTPADGTAILLNGRNILTLDSRTTIRDGDELTFTVHVAGG